MNDNQPLAVGDRVRRRDQPWLTGTVWSVETVLGDGTIVVEWDDNDDENAFVRPGRLERITPAHPPQPASKARQRPV